MKRREEEEYERRFQTHPDQQQVTFRADLDKYLNYNYSGKLNV